MLNDHTCHALGLQVLADTKWHLGKGQASNALDKLCMSILTWNLHFEFKKLKVHGQQQNTWVQHLLKMLWKEIVTAADTYHHACNALLHLGMDENDATFCPLMDNELYWKNTSKAAKLGDNRLVRSGPLLCVAGPRPFQCELGLTWRHSWPTSWWAHLVEHFLSLVSFSPSQWFRLMVSCLAQLGKSHLRISQCLTAH